MSTLNQKKVELLRDRDGGSCWLCQKPMNFKVERTDDAGVSVEHLIPQCEDGPNTLHNLVLCHPPCNKRLRDLPLAKKIKMREEHSRERWRAAIRRRIAALIPVIP